MRYIFIFCTAFLFLFLSFSALAFEKRALVKELENLEKIVETLHLDYGKTIRLGDKGKQVGNLVRALEILGFLKNRSFSSGYNKLFTKEVENAVRNFQHENNIYVDGIVGARTIQAINDSFKGRILRLHHALTTYPEIPQKGKVIVVNIASATMKAFKDGREVLSSPVIFGKLDTRTPLLTTEALSITFNPTWTVPPGVARRVYNGVSFIMPPGPENPLGKIRLNMPNRYFVFLHGTSAPSLFLEEDKALSAGCIRVQKIDKLAYWLLQEESWDEVKREGYMDNYITETFPLPSPVLVIITYYMAEAARKGIVYYEDPYGVLRNFSMPHSVSIQNKSS